MWRYRAHSRPIIQLLFGKDPDSGKRWKPFFHKYPAKICSPLSTLNTVQFLIDFPSVQVAAKSGQRPEACSVRPRSLVPCCRTDLTAQARSSKAWSLILKNNLVFKCNPKAAITWSWCRYVQHTKLRNDILNWGMVSLWPRYVDAQDWGD